MRFFWIFFCILVAATVGVFLLGDRPGAPAARTDTVSEVRGAQPPPRIERPAEPAVLPVEPPVEPPVEIDTPGQPQAMSAMPRTPEDAAPGGGSGEVLESSVVAGVDAVDRAPGKTPAPGVTPVTETVEAVIDAKAESVDDASVLYSSAWVQETVVEVTPAPEVKEDTPVEAVASSEPASEPAPVVTAPTEPTPSVKAASGPVQETETGLLLAGRWAVPGRGTREMPYVLSWEMLVAVQREYEPRLGKDKLPEWLEALQGKRVSIEGYVLLPIGGGSMSELLVMLNQWDGCCIGLPPTPFDAVEVRLGTRLAPNADQIFAQGGSVAYGRIKGSFEIDPYIASGWLLGLYLINDAEATLFGPAGSP